MSRRRSGVIRLALVASALTLANAADAEEPAVLAPSAAAKARPAAPAKLPAKAAPAPKAPAAKGSAKAEAAAASDAADEEGSDVAPDGSPSGELGSDPESLFEARLPSEGLPRASAVDRPLSLRRANDKPLELLAPAPSSGLGYKLLACALIVGGAAWLLKRRGQKPKVAEAAMSIVTRTSIGVRSELMLVTVDGQRLLLGVTPGSIARLAVLPPLEAGLDAGVDAGVDAGIDAGIDAGPADLAPSEVLDNEPGFERALRSARAKIEELAGRAREPALRRRPIVESTDEDEEIARIRAALRAREGGRGPAEFRREARPQQTGSRVSISVGDAQAAGLVRHARRAAGAK